MSNKEIIYESLQETVRRNWMPAIVVNTGIASFASYASTAESSAKISASWMLLSGFLTIALHTVAYRLNLRANVARAQTASSELHQPQTNPQLIQDQPVVTPTQTAIIQPEF